MLKRPIPNHRRRAVAGIYVIVMIPVLFGFAALALDLGSRAVIQSELQNAVDAAVLGGIQDLKGAPPDPDAAEAMALDILSRNVTWYGSSVAANASVEFGAIIIDAMSGEEVFQSGAGWDAMRVSTSFDHDYFFAALMGVFSTTVTGMASSGLMERPPVAFWRLGDTVGTTAVDETGTHDGQHFGEVTNGFGGVVAGDSSVRITENWWEAGRVEVPHSDDFLLDHGSVSFWFQTKDELFAQGIFSKDSSGLDTGGHLDIGIYGARVRVRLQSTTNSYYLYSPVIAKNQWYHVVASFGVGGMRLLFDGVQVDTDSYTGGLGTTSGGIGNHEPITLGVSQIGSGNQTSSGWYYPFHGLLDEVAIYNRGMTQRDAQWLYNAVQAGTATNGSVVRDGLLRM